MFGSNFRPWGLLSWVLGRLRSDLRWSLIGSFSTEERCLSALEVVKERGELESLLMMEVCGVPSPVYEDIKKIMLKERRNEFTALGENLEQIQVHHLFERKNLIVNAIRGFTADAAENVIIDISTFPERFFFPIIERILANSSIRNVIATYTIPEDYSETLAEDPQSWRHLPQFDPPFPEPEKKLLIVGLGYEPLSLPKLLRAGFQGVPIKLLFPFPSVPPGTRKNWDFMRQLEPDLDRIQHELIGVNKFDVSETYDRIHHILTDQTLAGTEDGQSYPIFAPYGTKPMSLAMCLYAIPRPSAVYYTQPKVYNPKYSTGVKKINGQRGVYAYFLRLNGVDLY